MTDVNLPSCVPHGLSAGDEHVDQLLHPAQFYARPANVVADDLLTIDERRAILSSWASDACAVESNPALRQSAFAPAPVTFDEIMDALLQLDQMKIAKAGMNDHPARRRVSRLLELNLSSA